MPTFIYSSIAQSVERMTVNHDVTGSSPVGGARIAPVQMCRGLNLSVVILDNPFLA